MMLSSPIHGYISRLDNNRGTPIGKLSENVDLGTPSAPPFMDIGNVNDDSETGSEKSVDIHYKEFEQECPGDNGFAEQSNKSVKTETEVVQRDGEEVLRENEHSAPARHENSVNHIPYYCASNQNAYQALVAYDACIRKCLNSWARGCTEAPVFLRDECLLLRNAFGLHKLLLQPRGVQQAERDNKSTEQATASKVKRTVGKIRVEVKKLRIIQRRKLKDTDSTKGAIYLQAGADYVRHVSSMVKHRINSLNLSSISFQSEESLCCVIQLKSVAEDNEAEAGSAISFRPGAGEYHDFFPESEESASIKIYQLTEDLGRAFTERVILQTFYSVDDTFSKVLSRLYSSYAVQPPTVKLLLQYPYEKHCEGLRGRFYIHCVALHSFPIVNRYDTTYVRGVREKLFKYLDENAMEIFTNWPDFKDPDDFESCKSYIFYSWLKHGYPYGLSYIQYIRLALALIKPLRPSYDLGIDIGCILPLLDVYHRATQTLIRSGFAMKNGGVGVYPQINYATDPNGSGVKAVKDVRMSFEALNFLIVDKKNNVQLQNLRMINTLQQPIDMIDVILPSK